MVRRRVAVAVACALAVAVRARGGEAPSRDLDPGRLAWSELRFAAHKMGLSATIQVRLEEDGAPAGAVSRGHSNPGGGEIVLESTTHLPGRVFVARERLDASVARVLEIVNTETGAKNHRKTYTLTGHGFLLDLLVPASLTESRLAPERWTRATRTFTSYPRALAPEAVVTGPVGLLYAASATALAAPGDEMTLNVLVQAQVERVTVRVEGVEPVELEYRAETAGGSAEVREEVAALRLVAHSRPVDAGAPSAFRIFGLEGDVQILWDPVRRLPVEIAGSVKVLGHVQVRLASVSLR